MPSRVLCSSTSQTLTAMPLVSTSSRSTSRSPSEPVGDGLDGAVAGRIGVEIDGSVIGEVDLAGLAVRAQELASVVTAGDRHRIEAEAAELACSGGDAGFREIPGIGVDGLVAHRSPASVMVMSAAAAEDERLLEGPARDFHRLAA